MEDSNKLWGFITLFIIVLSDIHIGFHEVYWDRCTGSIDCFLCLENVKQIEGLSLNLILFLVGLSKLHKLV